MTFLVFIFLLALVQTEAVGIRSTIFGPRIVTGLVGGSVTVRCFYPDTSVNRHDRKYWCKESTRRCETIVSSNGYVHPKYQDRANLTDYPDQGIFVVTMSNLEQKDMGAYKCGIGISMRGLNFRVEVDVIQESPLPSEAQLFYVEEGGSVTMDCDFGEQHASDRKYLCKMGRTGCSPVIDTYGVTGEPYKGRTLLTNQQSPGSFRIIIGYLKPQDSGIYLCGVGNNGGKTQEMDLHVYVGTSIPQGPQVIKGVRGGSVAVECHYDPRGTYTVKYWCKWRKQGCTDIIRSDGFVTEAYEGLIAMYDDRKNGTFTIIMNDLKESDAGYYWCMTAGDKERKASKELKIVNGMPGLTGEKEVSAVVGAPLTLTCSYPCKYYSFQKFWCKWNNTSCQPLISYEQNQTGRVVDCNQDNRTFSLKFDHVAQTDQGWYWCGVSRNGHYGETLAVNVQVRGAILRTADEGLIDNTNLEEDTGNGVTPEHVVPENRAVQVDSEKSSGQSQVLVPVLAVIGGLLLILALAFAVFRYRTVNRSDLVSVGSYRTNISMSEFENAKEHGANDNVFMRETQETQIGGMDEFITTAGTEEVEEPKKAKRGSKEEADVAYSTFLLQTNNIAQEHTAEDSNT
ncbi:PREDICTED: polymeric immunoglobulin receptor [Crocodylus porosus]|uniref:polymeric immunoglobulin receptor n=1 Tax=Crocodylus porosus TaxID=8502 RepID=UPI00093B3079|nr:PREDICTED: polymeric immunoglobulin receptor [Crocodylus porosus]